MFSLLILVKTCDTKSYDIVWDCKMISYFVEPVYRQSLRAEKSVRNNRIFTLSLLFNIDLDYNSAQKSFHYKRVSLHAISFYNLLPSRITGFQGIKSEKWNLIESINVRRSIFTEFKIFEFLLKILCVFLLSY